VKYFDFVTKLDAQTRFLGLIASLLAATVLILGFTIFALYSKKTVVILPPKVEKEFWVSGNVLSTSYLEQVAYFIADRVLSVSPQNVDASLDMIKPFFSTDPSDLEQLEKVFLRVSKTIKENDYYQVFYPLKFYVDVKHNKLTVDGILKKMSGGQYLGEERRMLEIIFYVRNGRFFVKSLKLI